MVAGRDMSTSSRRINQALPAEPLGQQRGDAKETTMVLYLEIGDVFADGRLRVDATIMWLRTQVY